MFLNQNENGICKTNRMEDRSYGIQEPVGEDLLLPGEADVSIIQLLGFIRKDFGWEEGLAFYDGAYASVNPKK